MNTAESGRLAIDFAGRHMPALTAAEKVVRAGGRLDGRRIALALVLEPKTANLALALSGLGAEVAVAGSPNSTQDATADALRDAGLSVFAERGASAGQAADLLEAFVDFGPDLLADDGATVVRHIHTDRRDVLSGLRGVAEETTSGVRPLRVMEAEGSLEVPCLAVNDARTKLAFDNVHGTGQSVVMALLDTTNIQLQGKRVVVVGYGRVGKGIAYSARALGARIVVTEIDPVEALVAHHDGHDLAPVGEAVADADVVITASGIGHSLTAEHVALMREGTIIAVGGAGPPEFDPTPLDPTSPDAVQIAYGESVRPGVRELTVSGGPTVFVIAEGFCANTSAAEGNPIEVMDLSLALQLRALDHLVDADLPVGVHLLPRWIDDEVALSQLRAVGISIDVPSDAQSAASHSW